MTLVRIVVVGLFAISCSNHPGSVDESAGTIQVSCTSNHCTTYVP